MQSQCQQHQPRSHHRPAAPPSQQWPDLVILQVIGHLPLVDVLLTTSLVNSTWHRLSLEHCANRKVLRVLFGAEVQLTTCVYAAERERTLELLSQPSPPPLPPPAQERLNVSSILRASSCIVPRLTTLFPRVRHLELYARTMQCTPRVLTLLGQVLSSLQHSSDYHLEQLDLTLGQPWRNDVDGFPNRAAANRFSHAINGLMTVLRDLTLRPPHQLRLRRLRLAANFALLNYFGYRNAFGRKAFFGHCCRLPAELNPLLWHWLEHCTLDTQDSGVMLFDLAKQYTQQEKEQKLPPPPQLTTTVSLPSSVVYLLNPLDIAILPEVDDTVQLYSDHFGSTLVEALFDYSVFARAYLRPPAEMFRVGLTHRRLPSLVRLSLDCVQTDHLPLLGQWLQDLPALRSLRLCQLRICSLKREEEERRVQRRRSRFHNDRTKIKEPYRQLPRVRELSLVLCCALGDYTENQHLVGTEAGHDRLERDLVASVARPLAAVLPNLSMTRIEVEHCWACDLYNGHYGPDVSGCRTEHPRRVVRCEQRLAGALRPLMPSITPYQYYQYKPYNDKWLLIAGRRDELLLDID